MKKKTVYILILCATGGIRKTGRGSDSHPDLFDKKNESGVTECVNDS